MVDLYGGVKELFVSELETSLAREVSEALPSVEITNVWENNFPLKII